VIFDAYSDFTENRRASPFAGKTAHASMGVRRRRNSKPLELDRPPENTLSDGPRRIAIFPRETPFSIRPRGEFPGGDEAPPEIRMRLTANDRLLKDVHPERFGKS
jgi:hypothetical protein